MNTSCVLGICTCYGKVVFKKKRKFLKANLLKCRKELLKFHVWSMALYGAETWTLRATDQERMESLGMRCCRRMEKSIWTDHVRNEEVLLRVN